MFNTEDREFIKSQVDRIIEAVKLLSSTSPTPSTSTPEPSKPAVKHNPHRTISTRDDARR